MCYSESNSVPIKSSTMGDDYADASPTNRNLTNSGENPPQNVRSVVHQNGRQNWLPTVDLNDMYYDMSGKKYMIILNHFKFKRTRHFWFRKPSERYGTDMDAIRLKELYEGLDFSVQRHNDLTRNQIMELFNEFCKMDHTETSCVIVAILTHGSKGDKVCATDRMYRLRYLTTMLENVSELVSKPKLFFVQACRGTKEDDGNHVKVRGNDDLQTVAKHSDFLILYSTVNDYLSYRNATDGSWLVQALCDLIEAQHGEQDMLGLITLLNQAMAYEYKTRSKYPERRNKKQVPETRFTLTKLLKF